VVEVIAVHVTINERHRNAVPVLHLFIWIVKFLSLSVDELNDDDDDDDDCASWCVYYVYMGQVPEIKLNQTELKKNQKIDQYLIQLWQKMAGGRLLDQSTQ